MKQSYQQHGGPNRASVHQGHGPYWKRAHHDWRFWVSLVLMLAAMLVYVMSDNLALRPHREPQPPPSGAVGK